MTAPDGPRFVVQRHDARTLHFDLRLEVDGALASWAVPKGPSPEVGVRRLAVRVDDHDLDHLDREGPVGSGTTIVWDTGTYRPLAGSGETSDAAAALQRGHLRFVLHGARLTGAWSLTRTRMDDDDVNWLLVRLDDAGARAADPGSVLTSVLSGRPNADYARPPAPPAPR